MLWKLRWGGETFLWLFFLAGILSNLGDMLTIPYLASSIGASGAILGVLGFLAVTCPFYPIRFLTLFHHPAVFYAILYGVADFVYLFTSAEPISYGAHLVGLFMGVLLGILRRVSGKSKPSEFI